MKKVIISLFLLLASFTQINAQCNIGVLYSFDPTCGASNNGGITVTTTGTFGTVNYTLMPGNLTNTNGSFVNLSAGTYTITSSDANLCTNATTVVLSNPTPVSITGVTHINSTCGFNGYNTTINGIGGSGVYTVSSVPYSNNLGNKLNLLSNTTYTITLVDAQGCTASTVYSTPAPVPPLTAVVSSNNSSCILANGNGSVCYTASNGVPPYSYSLWPGNLVNTTGCFNNLNLGLYTISVTDNVGCVYFDSISISNSNPIISIVTPTQPSSCNATDGSLCVTTILSGTPPYQYSLNNGPLQTNNCFSNLGTGTYTISVTDANNCTGTMNYTLPNNFLFVNPSFTSPTCNQSNGQLCCSVIGGAAPFQYSLNNGPNQTTNCFPGLSAGAYVITVTDANNCSKTAAKSLSVPNFLNSLTVTNPVCGVGTGSISASVSSLAAQPVTYQLMPGAISNSTGFFNGLAVGGPYTITATDANNCTATKIAFIYNNTNSGLSPIISNIGGTVTVNAPAGFVAPMQYSFSSPYQASNIFPGLCPGSYGCVVIDANGCFASSNYTLGPNAVCGWVDGTAYHDASADCLNNNGELGASSTQIVIAPSGNVTYTNDNGYYYYTGLSASSYTIFQNPNAYLAASSCGNYFPFTFLPNNTYHNFDFADTLYNVQQDMKPVLWRNANFTPGFNTTIELLPRKSNRYLNSNGTVSLDLDPTLTYTGANIPPSTIVGNTYTWNYSNSNLIRIYVNTPIPTLLNTLIENRAIVTLASSTDINPMNDTSYMRTVVRGAYDPNNKIVNPYGEDAPHNIDKYDSVLTYTINFQNVGNAPARNVVLLDTLSDKLEVFKFETIYASHDYIVTIMDNKVLMVTFEDIQLPDSTSNEPASHGQFVYQIHQKGNNNYGDVIKNKAGIYFDYNPPIITNEVFNTIYQKPTSAKDYEKNILEFSVKPIPAKNTINLNFNNEVSGKAKVLDISGKILLEISLKNNSYKTMDISSLSSGMYFMLIDGAEMRGLKKFIVE